MNIQLLDFQQKAVEQMRQAMNKLWQQEERTQMILHSPTGSGKTLMTCALIDSLQDENPEDVDRGDVAYFWITLNNELAMQSKDKFYKYFVPNLRNTLSTFDDCGDTLKSNEILFVNWQKLSQKRGKDRLLLRRPTDDNQHKESGFYFEDLMENTAKAGRRIVMIIDESHSNVGTDLSQEIIDYVNPKLILKVSATPFKDKTAETVFKAECFDNRAAIVKVEEKDVVAAGLIKEEIVCQTEDDLKRFAGGNIDDTMLALAKQKREELKAEWQRIGHDINPLVLIQLPKDEGKIEDGKTEDGTESKEAYTRRILKTVHGVDENRIATWLADKPLEPEWRISDNDSPIDFLIFKYAAGTGWDCPRAHVLVMFREIKSSVFHIQTLGRIKRMPVNGNDLEDCIMLRRGYLYTTYKSNEIASSVSEETHNKPKINKTKLKDEIKKRTVITTTTSEIVKVVTTPKSSDEEEKEEVSEEVKRELSKVITETIKEEVEKGVDENTEGVQTAIEGMTSTQDDANEKVRIETKAKSIADKSIQKLEEVKGTEISEEEKKEIKEIAKVAVETLADKRDAELILDTDLKTDFLSRSDYGDLGKASVFQKSFIKSMNEYFGISEDSDVKENLEEHNIELKETPTWEIMVGKVYRFAGKDEEGAEKSVDISQNDISRMFNNCCGELIKDNRIGNVARSWSVLSQALRQWFMQLSVDVIQNDDQWRRVFVYDYQKEGNSEFRKAVAKAFEDYKPVLAKYVEDREKDALKSKEPFKLKTSMAFDDDHEVFNPSEKSFQQPFYLLKEYNGRDNETSFIRFLEGNTDVEHWYKNGNSGKDALGIRYNDTKGTKTTADDEIRIFYPDWIVLYKNGDIGIYDTKSGITGVERSAETKDKLKALSAKIEYLNSVSKTHYKGGIYEPKNGGWELIDRVVEE